MKQDPPSKTSHGDNDYEIGYARPPKSGQFKPGKSGNPKGRKKGFKNLKSMVQEVLNEKVIVTSAKGKKKVSKLQAMLMKNANEALKGNAKAFDQVLSTLKMAGFENFDENLSTKNATHLADEDQAILDQYMDSMKPDLES